jgi:transposase, IS30 family
MNGRLRRTLPRKLDPSTLSGKEVLEWAWRMNATPRKCLGFKTPAEVFSAHLLHFKCESTCPPSRE